MIITFDLDKSEEGDALREFTCAVIDIETKELINIETYRYLDNVGVLDSNNDIYKCESVTPSEDRHGMLNALLDVTSKYGKIFIFDSKHIVRWLKREGCSYLANKVYDLRKDFARTAYALGYEKLSDKSTTKGHLSMTNLRSYFKPTMDTTKSTRNDLMLILEFIFVHDGIKLAKHVIPDYPDYLRRYQELAKLVKMFNAYTKLLDYELNIGADEAFWQPLKKHVANIDIWDESFNKGNSFSSKLMVAKIDAVAEIDYLNPYKYSNKDKLKMKTLYPMVINGIVENINNIRSFY